MYIFVLELVDVFLFDIVIFLMKRGRNRNCFFIGKIILKVLCEVALLWKTFYISLGQELEI